MSDDLWRTSAACLGADPDLFEPVGKGRPAVEGLRVCQSCPVRLDCLRAGVANDPLGDHGIWGGTTDHHRHNVRRGRWTLRQAMAAGDRLAEGLTVRERLDRDEPWLTEAVPVSVRANHRPEAWGGAA